MPDTIEGKTQGYEFGSVGASPKVEEYEFGSVRLSQRKPKDMKFGRGGQRKMMQQMIFYRSNDKSDLLEKMSSLMAWVGETQSKNNKESEKDSEEKNNLQKLYYDCVAKLYEYAGENGYRGNLWHCYLADFLADHENPYSIACEMRGEVEGTLKEAVLHDIQKFQEMFRYDLNSLDEAFGNHCFKALMNYEPSRKKFIQYNKKIAAEIVELSQRLANAASVEDFRRELDDFYGEYGVGVFGLHKAFRVERTREKLWINPIHNIEVTSLEDIVGYEIAKKKLVDNTEAFLTGQKANNCLIFGDAGTGKSSSIRAILNQYYDQGLRMIEIYKHQYQELNELIDRLKCRNYKFIIYMDDLSFEEFETEYKYLKAVIEGGLGSKPGNVLIYATSNRRHLIKESFADKENGGDIHKNETVQEKLSLFARFGVTIYFGAPDKKEFQNIVTTLAKRNGISLSEEELLLKANQWELSGGGRSGRTARQLIDAITGQNKMPTE